MNYRERFTDYITTIFDFLNIDHFFGIFILLSIMIFFRLRYLLKSDNLEKQGCAEFMFDAVTLIAWLLALYMAFF
jgi:hypothetical protein